MFNEPGLRFFLFERYDLIPTDMAKWAARVMGYGFTARNGKGPPWAETYPITGNKSPINHAEGHLAKAKRYPPKTLGRIWNLAKAMTNLGMQIWLETKGDLEKFDTEWVSEIYPRAVRKGKEKQFEKVNAFNTNMGEDPIAPITKSKTKKFCQGCDGYGCYYCGKSQRTF